MARVWDARTTKGVPRVCACACATGAAGLYVHWCCSGTRTVRSVHVRACVSRGLRRVWVSCRFRVCALCSRRAPPSVYPLRSPITWTVHVWRVVCGMRVALHTSYESSRRLCHAKPWISSPLVAR
eukprot:918023-Prymnesium_polylepis.2